MTDRLIHPTPEFDPHDVESREVQVMSGVLEQITLERFYWIHLDWYEENGFLAEAKGMGGLVASLDEQRETESVEDALRTFVDHWMIPTAIRGGLPPFDQWDEETRIAATRDAEVFRA